MCFLPLRITLLIVVLDSSEICKAERVLHKVIEMYTTKLVFHTFLLFWYRFWCTDSEGALVI